MSKKSFIRPLFSLFFLVAAGLSMPGCEKTEDPIAIGEFSPEESWLSVGSGAVGMESQWILTTPDGEEIRGSGGLLLPNPPEGEYWILWEPVEAYNSPAVNPERLVYRRGTREIFESTYERIDGDMGTLVLQPDLADSRVRWNLHGPSGFFAAGEGSRVLFGRGVGDYRVVWGEVNGYETPPATEGELDPSQTLTLISNYEPMVVPTGRIEIDPSPGHLTVSWDLDSAEGDHYSGLGDAAFDEMALGEYTVTWGEVEGYVTPQAETATLGADEALHFAALYLEIDEPTGTLVINPEPDALNARWQLASNHGWLGTGFGDQTVENLPVGEYAVVWSDIAGYLTPESIEHSLAAGQVLQIDGVYTSTEPPVGSVVIDPDPDELDAPWALEDEWGGIFTGSGDSTLTDLPMGDYTLTWEEVEGYETPSPNPVTQTLTPGGAAVFTLH